MRVGSSSKLHLAYVICSRVIMNRLPLPLCHSCFCKNFNIYLKISNSVVNIYLKISNSVVNTLKDKEL